MNSNSNTNTNINTTIPGGSSLSPPLPPPSSSSSVTVEPVTLSPPPMSATTTSSSSAPESRPPSKLPSRPRKLRKLDPTSTSTSNPNSSMVVVHTKMTPRPRVIPSCPPPRSLSSEGEIEAALAHLRAADPALAKLIDLHEPPNFDRFETPFLALTKSILYQQLAFKAGTSIYSRFVSICGGESSILPQTILSLTPHQLRQIGVSARKTTYLHDLARKYQNGILSDSAISNMDDKSLFTMLTMVNGIGSWSVHMFLIFSLHRPDVLPVNDLGVRKGVQLLYGLEDLPRPSQMDQLCDKWRPYRSVACWFIWRFLEAQNSPSTSSVLTAPNAMTSQQQQQQQQVQSLPSPHQQQFIDPINGIIDLGQLS